MPVLTLTTTGQTKRDLIALAYGMLGIAGFEFELSADEEAAALKVLDLMMEEHPFNLMGYNQGQHLPSDISGVADIDASAVYGRLAERIASLKRKVIVNTAAMPIIAAAYSRACSRYAVMPQQPLAPNTIRGSGFSWSRRQTWNPFINEPTV